MLNDKEIDLFLHDLHELYGYDFYDYSRESLKRRISKIFRLEKFVSFEEFRQQIISNPGYIEHLIDRLTVNVTQMYRDAEFFKELRETIIPLLAKKEQIQIWHAGCSTGEEVYSTAIILKELGILDRTKIHATDINLLVLEKAKQGTYPLSLMPLYERNYLACGGRNDFNKFFVTNSNTATIHPEFSKRVTFTPHNLASGEFIKTFDLIICRNVLIYFDKELRERVFDLFDRSLSTESFLALGEKETLKSSSIINRYEQVSKEKIWKKKKDFQGSM